MSVDRHLSCHSLISTILVQCLQHTKTFVASPAVFPVFTEKQIFHVSPCIKREMDETWKLGWPMLRHLLLPIDQRISLYGSENLF
jgi:hypothetical protein